MSDADSTVPYGYCQCGCGKRTPIASRTRSAEGARAGEPRRFVQGHYRRDDRTASAPNPSGLCLCGCGRVTPLATKTNGASGLVKGQHARYVMGHQARVSSVDYAVDEATGCWVWQRGQRRGGYGSVCGDGGRTLMAHRVYYERYKGPIPAGLDLDHLCRNRLCVNPAHLEAVTTAENVRRGRSAKLRADDVRVIRASPETPGTELAKRFGVSASTISLVRLGRAWKNV